MRAEIPLLGLVAVGPGYVGFLLCPEVSSPALRFSIHSSLALALGLPLQNLDQAGPEETSSCEWAVTRKEHKLSLLPDFQLNHFSLNRRGNKADRVPLAGWGAGIGKKKGLPPSDLSLLPGSHRRHGSLLERIDMRKDV